MSSLTVCLVCPVVVLACFFFFFLANHRTFLKPLEVCKYAVRFNPHCRVLLETTALYDFKCTKTKHKAPGIQPKFGISLNWQYIYIYFFFF